VDQILGNVNYRVNPAAHKFNFSVLTRTEITTFLRIEWDHALNAEMNCAGNDYRGGGAFHSTLHMTVICGYIQITSLQTWSTLLQYNNL
jgi:hypothetical protein